MFLALFKLDTNPQLTAYDDASCAEFWLIGRIVINNSDIKQISILAVLLLKQLVVGPVAAKARVIFQASMFWISGEKSGNLKSFSPSTYFVLPSAPFHQCFIYIFHSYTSDDTQS